MTATVRSLLYILSALVSTIPLDMSQDTDTWPMIQAEISILTHGCGFIIIMMPKPIDLTNTDTGYQYMVLIKILVSLQHYSKDGTVLLAFSLVLR